MPKEADAPMDGVAGPGVAVTQSPATPSALAKEASNPDASEKRETSKVFRGSGVMIKQPKAEAPIGGGATSLNFEAADIRDIAKTVLADILGESYIVDPKVVGTISLRTTRPLPRDAMLPTLESVLRMNGFIMVKENGIFKIMPTAAAKGSLSPKMAGKQPGFTVQVVPLKYIGSREMAKILEGFSPDPGAIKADELRNLLLVAGTQNEIQHMLDTVEMFDVDWLSGMSVGLFTLQNADVKAVDAEFNKIFSDKSLNPLAGVVRLIPLERLNGFVVISPQPHYLEEAKIWLERLDHAGTTGGTRLFVYHVQNGKAEVLADLLNQTFGKSGQTAPRSTPAASVAPGSTGMEIKSTAFGATAAKPATTSTPVAGSTLSISDESGSSEVRVVADKENNALLILSNAAGYDKIEAALRKLDAAPRQVLIEVMIAEVTLGDELKYGIEWSLTSGSRKSFQLDNDKAAGIGALIPGFSYALANAAGGVKAVLNMIGSDSKVNVLSSPHIMVADNQTAKIQVGESLPIQQQTLSTTGTFSATSYLDTGIMLSVTPRINAGGLVNLDITQEYSVPGITDATSSTNPPSISKRSTKTQVTVQSGETMVIGGMISEKSLNSSAGLPILSSIPLLGGLFGTTDRSTTKTELILLITPRVANNVGQAKQISDEIQRKMGNTKDLLDCGTYNLAGMSSRGGLWCMQARRHNGATDKMMMEDENGVSVYLKDEAKLEQEEAQRALDEANRKRDEAKRRVDDASKRVSETQGKSNNAVIPAETSKPATTQPEAKPGAAPQPVAKPASPQSAAKPVQQQPATSVQLAK
jgi:general secretion pathway protein D